MRKLFGIDGYVTIMRRYIFLITEAFLFSLILSVLAVVVVQVVTRYALTISTPWTGEIAQILLVWIVMIGAALAMERKEHYTISFIIDNVPERLRLIILILVNILGAIFLVLLVYIGWEYFLNGLRRTYMVTGLPRGVMFLALPVGAVLMLFSMVSQSLEALAEGKAQHAAPYNA